MNAAREKTLALLSVAALCVDALVVTIFVVGFQSALDNHAFGALGQSLPEWSVYVAIPVFAVLHYLAVELAFGGRSTGRLCTGLSLVDGMTGGSPAWSARIVRAGAVLSTLGLRSLSLSRLPAYSKSERASLKSDWAGVVTHTSGKLKQRPQSKGLSAVLSVDFGPMQGLTVDVTAVTGEAGKHVFTCGRDPAKSHLCLIKDVKVSRVQFRIAKRGARYLIIDGAGPQHPSSSGTKLNGVAVTNTKPALLRHGSVIIVGGSRISFLQQ